MKTYRVRFIPVDGEPEVGDLVQRSGGGRWDYGIIEKIVGNALVAKNAYGETMSVAKTTASKALAYIVDNDLKEGDVFETVYEGCLVGGLITGDKGREWKVGTAFDNITVAKDNAFKLIKPVSKGAYAFARNGDSYTEDQIKEEEGIVKVQCTNCKVYH
jgi:hypothetical protein